MQAVGGVIEAYRVQQSALLDSVTGETVQGRGFLSDAGQVAERRKTSRLYLLYYTVIVGMVAGGLVLLAHGAGYLDAGGSFATWLALTGGLALCWAGSGTATSCADAGEHRPARGRCSRDVALYESETRRLAIEWEHDAEARASGQAAQERAIAQRVRVALAQAPAGAMGLRIDELDARRKAIEAQRGFTDVDQALSVLSPRL
jgi:hypothetical protein